MTQGLVTTLQQIYDLLREVSQDLKVVSERLVPEAPLDIEFITELAPPKKPPQPIEVIIPEGCVSAVIVAVASTVEEARKTVCRKDEE